MVGGSPAFTELTGVLHDIVLATATNQAGRVAAATLDADVDDSADVQRAHVLLARLIEEARSDRAVREDLTLDDFYLLLSNAPDDQPRAVLCTAGSS